jgi:tRNA (cmo5U34)-methyltransferase
MLLEALPERVERFLDLGTGDGRLVALLRERYPDASAIGLDFSQPMLDRAAERFAADPLVELLRHDLAHPLSDLARPLPHNQAQPLSHNQAQPLSRRASPDAVVSALAIHHLTDDRKRALFNEVHSLLTPGGVFANLDLVASSTAQEHERFRRAIGRARDDPADRLAHLCEQLDWLRDAGFQTVDCQFKWLELALIVARSDP